jgi:hypothetical protein
MISYGESCGKKKKIYLDMHSDMDMDVDIDIGGVVRRNS